MLILMAGVSKQVWHAKLWMATKVMQNRVVKKVVREKKGKLSFFAQLTGGIELSHGWHPANLLCWNHTDFNMLYTLVNVPLKYVYLYRLLSYCYGILWKPVHQCSLFCFQIPGKMWRRLVGRRWTTISHTSWCCARHITLTRTQRSTSTPMGRRNS